MRTRAGYRDWLGLPAEWLPQFLTFEEARAVARTLGLQSRQEWKDWCKQRERPSNIPAAPWQVYAKTGEWAGAWQALEYKCMSMRPRCTIGCEQRGPNPAGGSAVSAPPHGYTIYEML